jgi:hypothetical protein
MMTRSALYMLSWMFIVLARWNNSSWIDMSPHSYTLSWFRANQSLLFLLNAAYLAKKQQIPILVFDLTQSGLKSTTFKVRMLTITLPLQSYINWTLIIVIIVSTTLCLNFCISALFIFGRWFVDSCTWSLFCNCLYLLNKMQIIQFSGYPSLLMSFEGSKNSLFLFFLQKWYCNCCIIYFLFCGDSFFFLVMLQAQNCTRQFTVAIQQYELQI